MASLNPFDERTRRRMLRGLQDIARGRRPVDDAAGRHRFLVIRADGTSSPRDRRQEAAPRAAGDLDTEGMELAFLIDDEYVDDETRDWLGDFQKWRPSAHTEWLRSVETGDDPARLHLIGLCAASARDWGRSFAAFQRAHRLDPARDANALDAALSHVAVAQLPLARRRLQDIVDADRSTVLTERARAALQQIDDVEAEDARQVRLAELQRESAREVVARGEATARDRIMLARATLTLHCHGVLPAPWGEVLNVLRPLGEDSVDVLEFRLAAHRLRGDAEQEDQVTRRLRRLAPQSPLLETSHDTLLAESRALGHRNQAVAMSLMETCTSRDDPHAGSALEALRDLATANPEDDLVLHVLAMCHLSRGEVDAAIRAARELADRPEPSHERHFNLAQTYATLDPSLRDHHLAAAYALADDDEERADALALRDHLLGDTDALDRRFR